MCGMPQPSRSTVTSLCSPLSDDSCRRPAAAAVNEPPDGRARGHDQKSRSNAKTYLAGLYAICSFAFSIPTSVEDAYLQTTVQRTAFVCCYNAAGVSESMFVVRLLGVLTLIALNGFFAAAEFSLVAVRLSRVRQLVAKGNLRARVVETLVGDLASRSFRRAAGHHALQSGDRCSGRSQSGDDFFSACGPPYPESTPC